MDTQMLLNPAVAGFAPPLSPGFGPYASPPGLASQRCNCGGSVPGADLTSTLLQSQQRSLQVMGMLVQLLGQLMLGGGTGASPQRGVTAGGNPGSSPATSQASGGNPEGGQVNGANPPGASGATDPPPGLPKIGPGTKVLEIGDSHTVGAYGQELERLLEGKGAQVTKDAVGGTATHQWLNGTAKAHKLDQLVAQNKPDVVIINLGANQRSQKPGSDIRKLAEMAVKGGAKVIWVGPPTTREDMKNPSKLKQYDDDMRAALGGLGTYISSAPFTPQYQGPDGIHYSTGAAKQWAQGIARAITGS